MSVLTMPFTTAVPYFSIQCVLDGDKFRFDVKYNSYEDRYYFDLFDATGEVICYGIKIVLGLPLLRKIADTRKPAGELFAVTTDGSTTECGLNDLNARVVVLYEEAA